MKKACNGCWRRRSFAAAIFAGTAAFASAGEVEREIQIRALAGKVSERLIVLTESAKDKSDKELGEALAALESADARLATVVPDRLLKTSAERADSLLKKVREGEAKGHLGALKAELAIFYGNTEGTYPKDLKELLPKHLKEIPKLNLPHHSPTSQVRVVDEAKGDKIDPFVKDSGGWLYIGDDSSKLWGEIVIDCTHPDVKGKPLYQY